MRRFDDDHVLVLLGPAHLVPVSFWQAVKLLLEPEGSGGGTDSSFCLQVPVVTTVPITQVDPPLHSLFLFLDALSTGAAARVGQDVAYRAQAAGRRPAPTAALSRPNTPHVSHTAMP